MNSKIEAAQSIYDKHLFICTFSRESGQSCGPSGGQKLREAVKNLCKSKDISSAGKLNGSVRINASGCLGKCEKGVAAVLYPEGKWLLGLSDTEQSREKLLSLINEQN